MSPVLPTPCPFDFEGDVNDKLEGGRLLEVTAHRFAYVYLDDRGNPERAIIASKVHGDDEMLLLWSRVDENILLYQRVIMAFGGGARNLSMNVGPDAGESVPGHAHLHVRRRYAGERASGMGLNLLVDHCNRPTRRVTQEPDWSRTSST